MDDDLTMSQESQSGPERGNSNSNRIENTSEGPGQDRRQMPLRTHPSAAPQEQTEQRQVGVGVGVGEDSRGTTARSSTRSGGYTCNACGARKKGHVCPFETKIHYVVESETQTDFPDDDDDEDAGSGNFGDGAEPNKVKSSSGVAPN